MAAKPAEIARAPWQQGQNPLAHLGAIIASSDDAIVSKSLDGIVRTWNMGAERIFGYTPDEMIGQSITILIPEELRAEEDMILARIRAGHRIDHFETERLTKDGRRIPIALTVSPIIDEDGRIIGASKIGRDITARRRAEEEAALHQHLLQVEAKGLGTLNEWSARLWACRSLEEGLSNVLEALVDLAGAELGTVQLLEADTLRFVAISGFDDFAQPFPVIRVADSSASGRALRLRQRVAIPDVEADPAYAPYLAFARRARYRSVLSLPLLTGQGHGLGVVSVLFREVRSFGEAELHRIDLYTRHASEFVQRCRAEEALHEADRLKDQFLAMLAHELRNPLAPIRTGIYALRLCAGDAQVRERTLDVLDRQAVHMTRLVDDLLDASRIRSGKIVLRQERVDLTGVLLQAVETSRPVIDAGQHQLQVEIPAEPIALDADPVRLAQIVSNLLNNAAKYTPRGGHIVLAVKQQDPSIVLSVSDNGMGIAPDMLTRVFGMFAQIDATLQRAQGGLGIGLSLVKALVELHGGTVEAFSDGEGHGSQFVVTLPLPAEGTNPTPD